MLLEFASLLQIFNKKKMAFIYLINWRFGGDGGSR
jgi:hypothetical protein